VSQKRSKSKESNASEKSKKSKSKERISEENGKKSRARGGGSEGDSNPRSKSPSSDSKRG